jgi:heme-degrading monooxygenase HmoA
MPAPTPPCYAVIFISRLTENTEGYSEMAERMLALARRQPGFLGFESARNETGISVSFWKDRQSIKDWRQQSDHQIAQQTGRSKWYRSYEIYITRVEAYRQYSRDEERLQPSAMPE